MKQLKNIFNLKSQKGSVTLFVLIAVIFFTIVLLSVYTSNMNKLSAQSKELEKIQHSYDKDYDEAYKETINNVGGEVKIILNKENGEIYNTSEWTNQNLKLKINYPTEINDNDKYFYQDGLIIKYTEDFLIEHNSVISVIYKGKTTKKTITKIDKQLPTAKIEPNGKTVITDTGTNVDIVSKITGEDNHSGVKEVKYAWSTDSNNIPSDDQFIEVENNQSVTKNASIDTYFLWTKITDNAKNTLNQVSSPFIIKEKSSPKIDLKISTGDGKAYTSGTWTNQNIYHEITIPESEGIVEKYQYTNNDSKWLDIKDGNESSNIDYKTTFPIDSNKPNFLGELQNNGSYYFTLDGTTLKSNNKGVNSSHANTYIPIDLTPYTNEDKLTISVNTTISSESGYDFGYAAITETTATPARSNAGKMMYISGATLTNTYTTEISGGKMYYLHFGYTKDGSSNSNNDCFIVNNLSFTSERLGKTLKFNAYNKNGNIVTYQIAEECNSDIYVKAIYTGESTSKISDKFSLKIDKTAPTADIDYTIISKTKAEININNIVDKKSGIKGYYISKENIKPNTESSWITISSDNAKIPNLDINNTYYVWLIDNVSNITEAKTIEIVEPNYLVDNITYTKTLQEAVGKSSNNSTIKVLKDYTDSSVVSIDKDITLDIQQYILTRTQAININSSKNVTIVGDGVVTANIADYTIKNSGNLTINMNGKIENNTTNASYGTIYSSTGKITIQKGNINGGARGININSGSMEMNGGTIKTAKDSVYNNSSSSININSGYIEGSRGVHVNSSSTTINIKGGTIKGVTEQGIYVYSGTANIEGGTIEGKTYGIYLINGTTSIKSGNIKGDYGIYQYSNNANIIIERRKH